MAVHGASLTDVVIALGTVYTPRVAHRGATLVLRELYHRARRGAWRQAGNCRAPAAHLASPLLVQGTFVRLLHLTEALVSRRGCAADQPDLGQHDRLGTGIHAERRLVLAPGLASCHGARCRWWATDCAMHSIPGCAADMSVPPLLLEVVDLRTFPHRWCSRLRWMASASPSGRRDPAIVGESGSGKSVTSLSIMRRYDAAGADR
jgi:hypothetical protein